MVNVSIGEHIIYLTSATNFTLGTAAKSKNGHFKDEHWI